MFRELSRYPVAELREAVPDYLIARMGGRTVMPHPVATDLAEMEISLRDIAAACQKSAEAKGASRPAASHPGAVLGAGMGTDDFRQIMGDTVRQLTVANYDQAAEEHRAICRTIPVKNFKANTFPAIDASEDAEQIGEAGTRELRRQVITASNGLTGTLETHGKLFVMNREVVVNDDLGALEAAMSQTGSAIARTEAQRVYGVLTGNPTLADGGPMFHADYSNVITGTVDEAGLAAAMAALRNQPTASGTEANHQGRVLLVPPTLEHAALKLVRAISLNTAKLRVIAAPWIADGTWYLLADPAAAPVVGLLYLEGNGEQQTVQAEAKPLKRSDGLGLLAWSDFGAVALGRVGAVRVSQ